MKKSAKQSRAAILYDMTRSVMTLTEAARAYREYDPEFARRIQTLVSRLDSEIDYEASMVETPGSLGD